MTRAPSRPIPDWARRQAQDMHASSFTWKIKPKEADKHDPVNQLVALKETRSYHPHVDLAFQILRGKEVLEDPTAEVFEGIEAAIASLQQAYPTNVPHATRVLKSTDYSYGPYILRVTKEPIVLTTDPLVARDIVRDHGTQTFRQRLDIEDSSELYRLISKGPFGYPQYGASASWSSRRQAAARRRAANERKHGVFDTTCLADILRTLKVRHPDMPPLSYYFGENPMTGVCSRRTYTSRREAAQCAIHRFVYEVQTLTPFQINVLCRSFPDRVYSFLAQLHDIAYYLDYHKPGNSPRRRHPNAGPCWHTFVTLISQLRRRVQYPRNPLKELPTNDD